MSTNVEHIQRPLMTVDEVMRLPAAKKEGIGANRKVVEPGAMLIFVTGVFPIYGTQMLYFVDKELNRRASFLPPKKLFVIDHKGDIDSKGTLKLLPASAIKNKQLASTNQAIIPQVQSSTPQAQALNNEVGYDQQLAQETDEDDRELAEESSEDGSSTNTSHAGGEGQNQNAYEDSDDGYADDESADAEYSAKDGVEEEVDGEPLGSSIHIATRTEMQHNER